MNSTNSDPAKPRLACDWMLVVDDDEPMGSLLVNAYSSEMLDVVYARSGLEALRVIDQRDTEPLLVITDVLMPLMDGLTLARKLCVRLKHSKIVVMSGHLTEASYWPADLREISFLAKPFSMMQLHALLEVARNAALERS